MTYLTRYDKVGVEPFDSIAWALEVHVKIPDSRKFHSAILYGNEDSPYQIDFFTQKKPLITHKPVFIWKGQQ